MIFHFLLQQSKHCKHEYAVLIKRDFHGRLPFVPTAYVPTALWSYSSMFQRLYVPTVPCCRSSMFPQLYVPTVSYSHSCMFPQFHIPTALFSHSAMFPQLYVLIGLCSHSSVFPQLHVPTTVDVPAVPYSHSSVLS